MSGTSQSVGNVVIGAGAAGLMAAIFAARAGADVVLIDGKPDGGRKILISGGGRCNVLPSMFDASDFHTESSRNSLRRILDSWKGPEQRRFFEVELGLSLELEPETGKLFPTTHRARDVRDRLVEAARESGVRMWMGNRAVGVEICPSSGSDSGWSIELEDGGSIPAHTVTIATGGLSVPKTGSDGFGLRIAERFGHTVRPTYPALTPLTLDPPRFSSLAGVSCTATLRAGTGKTAVEHRGGFLFTHRGFSGPTVLNVSHVAVRALARGEHETVSVCWGEGTPDEWRAALEPGPGAVGTVVRKGLPRRLADALIEEAAGSDSEPTAETSLSRLRRDDRRRLLDVLSAFPLPYTGSEGYRTAEVTGGGVALQEVDPRTLESRKAPGLYFCGEVLDAFGPIGGYNFAWAWATGRLAGMGAASEAVLS